MKIDHSKSEQSGLMLIELLIIVAIIGILGAIAIPQYKHLRAKVFYKQSFAAGETLLPFKEWKVTVGKIYTSDQYRDLNERIEAGIVKLKKKIEDVVTEVEAKPNASTTDGTEIVIKKVSPEENKERITWNSNSGGKW